MKLKGDVALITGASKGIGRAIALTFAREGARVVVNYNKSVSEGLSVVEEILLSRGDAIGIKADISVSSDVNRMIADIINHYGRIDILVNNAGIYPRIYFLEMKEEDWDNMINVNLKSVFLCSQAAGRIMRNQGGGRIVSISSGLAVKGAIRGVHYSASKAGIIGLTRSLALELAPYHIRVNCCAPGIIATDMPLGVLTKNEIENLPKRIPIGRVGVSQDIANVVLFLVSEDSSYMTGSVVFVDGGGIDALGPTPVV